MRRVGQGKEDLRTEVGPAWLLLRIFRKGISEKSWWGLKEMVTSLTTQRRAAIPQLEANPLGQPRKAQVQLPASGRGMGVI